jgi:hypothetical protein
VTFDGGVADDTRRAWIRQTADTPGADSARHGRRYAAHVADLRKREGW